MENNAVIYQSNDGLVKMEAIVDASNETIWATQKAMAELFGIDLSGVSKHISNIYEIGVNVGCKLIICRYLPFLT